jgi:threonine dehydrogenase-like Zn-dependent dehydrogenase
MQALVFASPGVIASREEPIPPPRPGRVLARVEHLGICGTDVHLLRGTSDYFRLGLTSYPVRFGHEWVGTVVAVADDVINVAPGDRVVGEPMVGCGQCQVCRAGGFNLCPDRDELGVRGAAPGAAAEYFSVPWGNVHRVPPDVPATHAVLGEPTVTVLHTFDTANVQPGERIAVVGAGTLGLIAVQLGSSMACPVDVIARSPSGRAAARAVGARATYTFDEAPDDAFDVVLEMSGSPDVGPLLPRVAAVSGRLLQVGIPPGGVNGFDLTAFVVKGLTLTGVLAGVQYMPRALELIRSGAVRADALIDRALPVGRIDEALRLVAEGGRPKPKILIDMADLPASG